MDLRQKFSGFLGAFVRIVDVVALITSGAIAWIWSYGSFHLTSSDINAWLVLLLFWVSMTVLDAKFYRSWRGTSLLEEAFVVIRAVSLIFASTTFMVFDAIGQREDFPRLLFLKWFGLCLFMLLFYRISLRYLLRWMRRRGYNQRRVIVLGTGPLGQRVIETIAHSDWTGLDVVGCFDDQDEPVAIPNQNKARMLGTLNNVPEFIRNNPIDQVWIALPLREEDKIGRIIYDLRNSFVEIRFIPDIFGFDLLNHQISEIAGLPVINLTVTPMRGGNRLIKALEDRIFSILFIVLFSPLLLCTAILIKTTSPGTIIFRQKRHGWDGREFNVLKFRTMYEHETDNGVIVQARKNDPRVTPVGAFLRRWSLDELPQFINVARGEMSIVGPRPHPIELNEYYKDVIDNYMRRHFVKPGITGWAQVNGLRGETKEIIDMEKRVESDLYYISNWSFWLDLRIIFMTAIQVFRNKNVY